MPILRQSIETAMFEGETGLPESVSSIKLGYYFTCFSLGPKKPNLTALFKNVRNERQFKALTGVSCEEFMIILSVFSECYTKTAWEEYERGERERRPGGGRKGKLPDMKDKLFFVLYYLKNYDKFDVIGHKFDLDKSSAWENAHKLVNVLLSALAELGVLPKRAFNSPEELKEAFNNVSNLFIDATERPCCRSADYETQKKFLAEKRRGINLKIQQFQADVNTFCFWVIPFREAFMTTVCLRRNSR